MIFVIYKLWTDSMENHSENARGYDAIGYVDTEEQALVLCNKAELRPKGYPLDKPTPNLIYKKLEKI